VRAGLLLVALAGLGADGALALAGEARVWALGTVPVLGVLVVEIVTGLRRGEYGLDVVAALSMAAALVFGETLAAAMVALMYAGGQYLESFAEARARREMTALLARAPRTAMRHRDDRLEEVALEASVPGDRLVIRRGDMVPVDGAVAQGVALLDESALTGEALPVRHDRGGAVMSGPVDVGRSRAWSRGSACRSRGWWWRPRQPSSRCRARSCRKRSTWP
jgi:cation transport ATPase